MDMTHSYWEENSDIQRVKYESGNLNEETTKMKEERGLYQYCETNLNFSTATCSEDDCEYNSYKKSKVTSRQDPMSHRIIEKRRRDRMNNCLADLSRLIPAEYLKKGRGRIEKTEIIEMAIKHMKYLQQEHVNPTEQYRLGYQECMSETMRFMVEVEGHFPREAMCVRLLNHLQKHCEAISHSPNIIPSQQQQQQHQQNQLQQQQSQTTSVTTTIDKNLTTPQYNERNTEFQVTKTEKETNNNNRTESDCEKLHNTDNNGISYKYKTSIKMRFSQDLSSNHHVDGMKRQKTDNVRRNSVVSTDNQCSSHSSPPSSELCTRISDAENASGRDSVASMPNNNPLKLEPNHRTDINRYSPKQTNQCDLKHNFNIPIFALHAKGSYYIPLTIDYKTLLPYLQSYDLLEVLPSLHSVVLHPVTINVNFQQRHHNYDLSTKYKTEYISNNWQ